MLENLKHEPLMKSHLRGSDNGLFQHSPIVGASTPEPEWVFFMAYRFTNTDKWKQDAWFLELPPLQKLLFIYLCENCDIAGFIEVSEKRYAFETGIDVSEIKGALEGLRRAFITSQDGSFLYLKNFIKHQKNIPLNDTNKAHIGIISRLEDRKHLFGFQSIEEFLPNEVQGACKGLQSPSGIGKGNSNKKKEEYEEEKESFIKFWNLYDKKVGDKKKLVAKWCSLKNEDRDKIFETLPYYVASTPDKKFRKDPATYLNQSAWNNEIIGVKIPPKPSSPETDPDYERKHYVPKSIPRSQMPKDELFDFADRGEI